MAHRLAIGVLAAACPVVLMTLLWSFPAAPVLFGALVMAAPVALIALGATRRGRLGPVTPALAALLVLLEGGLAGLLALRGGSGSPIAGLPLRLWLQLGLLVVPLVLTGLAYALTFDRHTLREEDLARLPPPTDGGSAPPTAGS